MRASERNRNRAGASAYMAKAGGNMNDKTGWDCVRFWAQALEEKYPGTDLLSLQDRQLKEMLLSLDSAAGLPALPDDNVYFWAVKSA